MNKPRSVLLLVSLLSVSLVSAVVCCGCGHKNTGANDDAGVGQDANVGNDASGADAGTIVPPTTTCPGRLEPVAPTGVEEVVGDGTPESCTEQALHDAVDVINATEGGGTLSFDCGGAHTFNLTSSVYLTEDAIVDGHGLITLSGGGSVRVIELDNYLSFVLQRITIRDGFVPAGSDSESGAGLLHPWFGTLEVIDATFLYNHSASQDHDVGGGAIYAGGLTHAVLSGAVFVGNSGSTGGAVLSRSTNLRVVDTVFLENVATTWADSGQYGNGGGLYIDRMWLDDPVDFVICGGVFERNRARLHGSAFFSYNLEGTGARFELCTFKDNVMEGSGTGTVYHEGVPLALTGSTFSGNTTFDHAGGLFLGGGSDADVVNCTFEGNTTNGNAGGLWAGNGVVTVTNVTFANNSADYGPAIFKGQDGTVTLTNVIFDHNTTENAYSAVACHETFGDGGGNVQWPDVKNNGNSDTPCAQGIVFADPSLSPSATTVAPPRPWPSPPAARPSMSPMTARTRTNAGRRASAYVTRAPSSISPEPPALRHHSLMQKSWVDPPFNDHAPRPVASAATSGTPTRIVSPRACCFAAPPRTTASPAPCA